MNILLLEGSANSNRTKARFIMMWLTAALAYGDRVSFPVDISGTLLGTP
jgi:hypothetical protein